MSPRSWFSRKKDRTPIKLTREEKRRSKMTSSVDPTRAITEDEPFAVSQSKTGASIKSLQHKDVYGNIIAEPDLSNPTRSRWERPLETIRSFEAQINRDARLDHMDQSQKHIQHNSGLYDSSHYHRNSGAQRYTQMDAYRNSYDYRGQNSQESFDRNYSRRQSMRSTRSHGPQNFEQAAPVPPINGHGYSPGQHMPRQSYDSRSRQPEGNPSRGAGTGSEHYTYNSDPNSESSSFGSNNPQTRESDLQFTFNETSSLHLGTQHNHGDGSGHTNDDDAQPDGNGYSNEDGYVEDAGYGAGGYNYENGYRNSRNGYNGYYAGGGNGYSASNPFRTRDGYAEQQYNNRNPYSGRGPPARNGSGNSIAAGANASSQPVENAGPRSSNSFHRRPMSTTPAPPPAQSATPAQAQAQAEAQVQAQTQAQAPVNAPALVQAQTPSPAPPPAVVPPTTQTPSPVEQPKKKKGLLKRLSRA